MKYRIQGLLKNVRSVDKSGDRLHFLKSALEGLSLDEIQINMTINNKNELKQLLEFLQYSEPCFKK